MALIGAGQPLPPQWAVGTATLTLQNNFHQRQLQSDLSFVLCRFFSLYQIFTKCSLQFLSKRQFVLANLYKFKLQSREQLPLTKLSSRDQFRHVLSHFLSASMAGTLGQRQPSQVVIPATQGGGLKKMPPYWYPYTTMAKERWLGREILEIVSTEFRDRSMEYYVGAHCFTCQLRDLDQSPRRGTLWNRVSLRSMERSRNRRQ